MQKLASCLRRSTPLAVVAAALLASFVVAAVWLHRHDRFAPLFDLALTELRVRDVGTSHTPLVGLPGRLGSGGSGSHPGPLSFYLLAPVYQLLGGSYWGLRVATLLLHAVAIVTSLAIARRRAGTPAVIGVGLVVVMLEMGFGLLVFSEPWNPNLPVSWFLVFVLSMWSVVAGDPWFLPLAAFAGCFCAQTHVPYLAVCGGIAPFALIACAAYHARARHANTSRHAWALLSALVVVVVLWIPPMVDEVRNTPGNLSLIFHYFSKPPAATVGFAKAARIVVEHLDAWHLVVDATTDPAVLSRPVLQEEQTAAHGLATLLLWAASALPGRRRGGRELASLNYVLAASLAVEVVAISRIIGAPWQYLLYSCWVLGALTLFATAWGLLSLMRLRVSSSLALYPAVGVLALASLRVSLGVRGAGSSSPEPSVQLDSLASQTIAALRRSELLGPTDRALVVWYDPIYGGAQGIGLLNELERSGLRAFTTAEYGRLVTPHRTGALDEATSLVMLAGGDWITDAGYMVGSTRVAYSDPRDESAREEFDAASAMLATALRQLGRRDIAARLGHRLSEATLVPGLHPLLRLTVNRMTELGVPAAVFVLPLRRQKSNDTAAEAVARAVEEAARTQGR